MVLNRYTSMLFLVYLLAVLDVVAPHGRLIEPPARSCMWRYGFPTEPDYNDNALFCGGLENQWTVNNGKCGVCGDDYNEPHPRRHELGGTYGSGMITGYYRQGQVIRVQIEITANHGGHFEFRLCPDTSPLQEVTQDCLDRNRLHLTNNKTRFIIPSLTMSSNYTIDLQLPDKIKCDRCVLQWKWVTANSWGCNNPPNDCCVGCGSQETFVNCADINIHSAGASGHTAPVSVTNHYHPTAVTADKPTVLVMDNGEEVLLDTIPIPNVPKPAVTQTRHQPWMDTSLGIQAKATPEGSHARDRTITPGNSPPAQQQVQVFSASSSSYAVEPALTDRPTGLSDPHIGQDYSSSKSSAGQTGYRSSGTSTQTGYSGGSSTSKTGYRSSGTTTQNDYSAGSSTSKTGSSSPHKYANQGQSAAVKPPQSAPSLGIDAGVSDDSALSIDVLQSLAAIMQNAKPVSCQPKYIIDGFNVDCDRLCVPSGTQCRARQQIQVMNAACKIMCKITA